MKAQLECLECILKQARRAASLATDDPTLQRAILNAVAHQIPHMDLNESPAVLSLCVYQIVHELGKTDDAYRAMKRKQNAMALELEPKLVRFIDTSTDPLVTAIRLAAAGNIIDLGILEAHEINPEDAIHEALHLPLGLDHTYDFIEGLRYCDDLLYLLDNAGEIVFDKLLIRELGKQTHVTAVVKGAPIINDACMEDAVEVGLTRICEVIDNGGAFVGSPLSLVPEPFLDRMRRADIILGKGQGNYETVDEFDGNVYLLLKIKCNVVAEHSRLPVGAAAFISARRVREEGNSKCSQQNQHRCKTIC